MRAILLALMVASASVVAAPSAPTAEQVAEWAAFTKPVHLEARKIDRGDWRQWGDSIWVCGYEAKKESLSAYTIGLYKAGTLFGKNRAEMEAAIATQVEKLKERSEKHPETKSNDDLAKHIRIETRPDGRKVFFTVMGFGPGGVMYGGFTTIGQYDLLCAQIVDFEDDMTQDQKLKDPAKPTAEFADIFKKIEQHVAPATE